MNSNSTQLYGITNCDTVRKARKWLEQQNIEFTFINFRKEEFTQAAIQSWLIHVSFKDIVNKRSQGWKKLTEHEQISLMTNQTLATLVETPTLIKRPVLQTQNSVTFGFKEADYQPIFAD